MLSKWTVDNIPDLTGKVTIITGANSGLGYEDARALAYKGATVILACRNMEKGEIALQQIRRWHSEARVELMQLDLADLASIHNFANEFNGKYSKLDILINNAGLMFPPFMTTTDGFELQFGTNHLGHFALTGLLLDHIINTPKARVVNVSSLAHRFFSKIDFYNLNAETAYNRISAYCQSKLANLLFTFELQRRFKTNRIDAIAVAAHPGLTSTNLKRYSPRWSNIFGQLITQKPEIGALPTLYAATAPDVKGGDYYGPSGLMELRGYPARAKISKKAYDKTVADRLWMISKELTGVQYHQLSKK